MGSSDKLQAVLIDRRVELPEIKYGVRRRSFRFLNGIQGQRHPKSVRPMRRAGSEEYMQCFFNETILNIIHAHGFLFVSVKTRANPRT